MQLIKIRDDIFILWGGFFNRPLKKVSSIFEWALRRWASSLTGIMTSPLDAVAAATL